LALISAEVRTAARGYLGEIAARNEKFFGLARRDEGA